MDLDKGSFQNMIDNLYDGLYFVDQSRTITYWNKAAARISGFSATEVLGKSCSDNILNHVDADGNQLCFGGCPLKKTIADAQPREGEVYLHHKNGHRIPVSVRVSVLTNQAGEVIGGVELFTDISNRSSNELRLKELEQMARLDRLTQLANRNHIETELQMRFEEKKRYHVPFGILFMDIDNFKKFNDTYGHAVGDEVLKYVAKTLVKNSRPFDLYGRWGGEEFLGIIRNITGLDLENLGNRLRLLVEASYLAHDSEKLHVTISIGATLVKEGDTIATLINRADSLLYQSKNSGRNRLTKG